MSIQGIEVFSIVEHQYFLVGDLQPFVFEHFTNLWSLFWVEGKHLAQKLEQVFVQSQVYIVREIRFSIDDSLI